MRVHGSTAGKQPEAKSARTTQSTPRLAHLQQSAGNFAVQRALSSGSPLPRELRAPLERYFRTPLDRVRIHSDHASRALADSLGARAFTHGPNIHLGTDGTRATGTDLRKLVAHEVVHTLQQREVGPRAKVQVGAPHNAHEQQADRIAESFERGGVAEAAKPVAAPVIQRAMHPTHYGRWEDRDYHVRQSDATHATVGIEMHLAFHPNHRALADSIALTQTVKNTKEGRVDESGLLGLRQATVGVGLGQAIDQLEGNPNPLYATEGTAPRPGGKRERLEDYPTNPASQRDQVKDGQHYEGHGQHGRAKMVNGELVAEPAVLRDAPHMLPYPPKGSSQVFETAALGIGGPSGGTYFGSVEWGWKKDQDGMLETLPFRIVSEGVPSAGFLTAASLWNATRADFAYETTDSVQLATPENQPVGKPLPPGKQLIPTRRTADDGKLIEVESPYGVAWADASVLRPRAAGLETLDLPVPRTYTVNPPAGTQMFAGTKTLLLPQGTRVSSGRRVHPTLTFHVESTVADGPLTGERGYVFVPDLTPEPRGTR